jgi:hypothetical protein
MLLYIGLIESLVYLIDIIFIVVFVVIIITWTCIVLDGRFSTNFTEYIYIKNNLYKRKKKSIVYIYS